MLTALNSSLLQDAPFVLSIVMILMAGPTLVALIFINAPYGRYTIPTKFSMNPKLAWCIQESPAFFIPIYFILKNFIFYPDYSKMVNSLTSIVLLTLFSAHYFNRSILYSSKICSTNRVPMYVSLLAFIFCIYNGCMQSIYLLSNPLDASYMCRPNFIIGICLFLFGMFFNIKLDDTLIEARKKVGPGVYVIPKGGLFEYVSCANYLSEIIEWLGFAIANPCLPSFAFLMFTICNVVPRAYGHHQWYLSKFHEYPKNRKILIPYLW